MARVGSNLFRGLRAHSVCGAIALACAAVPAGARGANPFDCSGIAPASGAELRAELVADGLENPVDVAAPPGDTARLFVVEQRGRIRIIDLATDALRPQAFLDITARVNYGGEKGLLGLAFHPRYAENGLFFVNYTRTGGPTGLETAIARFQVSSDPEVADPTATVLLTYAQPFANHNGGQVAFGPLDGYLYISTGDGGSGGDPNNNGQNPLSYLGKLLRIDVDSGDPYAVPATNPFAGSAGVLGEIWALGLRNPWRFTFDPENGDIYIADVGQGLWEEVDYQPGTSAGGENYEWRTREGAHSYSAGTSYGPGTRTAPLIEYPHPDQDPSTTFEGVSVTGGVLYRGCSMTDLHGAYFYADYGRHWVRTFRVVDGKVTDHRDRTAELNLGIAPDLLDDITAFGTDGRGEVYICDFSRKLFRVVPANTAPVIRRVVRGDANDDGEHGISDALFTLRHLFRGDPPRVDCADALDSNDDGSLDVSDGVYIVLGLFAGGPPPPPPYPDCGEDPTADSLDCAASTCE
ncbi:MAG: PQQ-dependent sugar dehydrogenase [Planctomycetes bacterium]|nr:PQQ-dependent sugar dehydrogenase [Planctomycetota bacterium]